MTTPASVVLPVSANSAQKSDKDTAEITSAIQQTLHEKTHPEKHKEREHIGPLKQIIAHQDSLYKYISWEDPIRSVGSYICAISILFGAHYLPLTQLFLKAGFTTLGVVSIVEFASRSCVSNSLSTRLRPKEYKKVPESTLNATLKDIHDFIQYAVVQAQRIVYGQDLDITFAAFLGFTSLYWLVKTLPPFWISVLGLTSLYIAPLVASSHGREVAHDASVRAQEVAHDASVRAQEVADAAARNVRGFGQHSKTKAAELSSEVRQTAFDEEGHIENKAKSRAETAVDHSGRAPTSGLSQAVTEDTDELPQVGMNALNKAPDIGTGASDDARNIRSSFSTNIDVNGSATETGGQMAPERKATE